MPSISWEICLAVRRRVPLNNKCSIKCETPLSSAGSYRPPARIQKPMLTLAMCGIVAVATVNPFSSRVI
jgi:hypothetical protein